MKPYLGLALAALLSVAATTALAQTADLSITMTAASATATPGSNLVYTITVLNNGPNPAVAVQITDPLPPGLAYVNVVPAAGSSCAFAGGLVQCSNPAFASGATDLFTLTAQLGPAAVMGATVTNVASISSATADSIPANNSASAAVTVVAAAPAAVPTLTEWAMILFGALLAGGAALHLQHRRRAA